MSFLDNFPDLKKEWDFEKNSESKFFPENFSFGSHQKVYWKCQIKNCHKWEALINKRTGNDKTGCPICSNKKICQVDFCNSLEKYLQENKELNYLIQEWDEEENEPMKKYTKSCGKKVYWKCQIKNCHKWEASIDKRTGNDKTGCPFCKFSKLEKYVEKYLVDNKIEFVSQEKFEKRYPFILSEVDLASVGHRPVDE